MKKFTFNQNYLLIIFTLFGIITPFINIPLILSFSEVVTTIFIKTLKTISLPILFLSLTSTLSSMKSLNEMKNIAKKVVYYTFSTTTIAALIALSVFIYVSPSLTSNPAVSVIGINEKSYMDIVLELFPSNFVQPFADGNAFGVVLIAFALGISSQFLPEQKKEILSKGFDALFSLFLLLAKAVTLVLPIAAWAFTTDIVISIQNTSVSTLHNLFIFLICIVSVNLIQGFIALPLLLVKNGISPKELFSDMSKSISVAFLTKSSSASLPFSLDLITKKPGVSSKVSNFSLPLCSTINMNGCAQFILLSILFSSVYSGVTVGLYTYIFWVSIAIFAAVGNAGVPMGCYFLASLLLTSCGVPLTFMGLILPFYPILDMIETGVNVWSDICITKITDKQIKEEVSGVQSKVVMV